MPPLFAPPDGDGGARRRRNVRGVLLPASQRPSGKAQARHGQRGPAISGSLPAARIAPYRHRTVVPGEPPGLRRTHPERRRRPVDERRLARAGLDADGRRRSGPCPLRHFGRGRRGVGDARAGAEIPAGRGFHRGGSRPAGHSALADAAGLSLLLPQGVRADAELGGRSEQVLPARAARRPADAAQELRDLEGDRAPAVTALDRGRPRDRRGDARRHRRGRAALQ